MPETRAEIKERLQQAGLWKDYLALRGELVAGGMTAAEARAEALRRVESPDEDEADEDDPDEDAEGAEEPIELRPVAEYAEYREFLVSLACENVGAEAKRPLFPLGQMDVLETRTYDHQRAENESLAAKPDAAQLGRAAKNALDAAIGREAALHRRVVALEGTTSVWNSDLDDIEALMSVEEIAAVLAWHAPEEVIATLRAATEESRRRYTELQEREQHALTHGRPGDASHISVGGLS